ncbi:branched-chain amino acid ABC transporter permease [Actinomadura physcomitrii]|uniref:branched-chain amino acid ABC transporter permease n=1 Tax=Actinomadura physcomitrii TaxID=2650748 RepID=UPI00136D6EFD|nr:branched-chain amino acid ABC transporter permease [Actinomadura physcomitrii]
MSALSVCRRFGLSGFLTSAVAVLAVAAPWIFSPYTLYLATLAAVYAFGAIAVNLATGYIGILSLAPAGFYAVGAYSAAVVGPHAGDDLIVVSGAAIVISAVLALVLALPVLRLKGIYLAIATFAFALVVQRIIVALDDITGGNVGKSIGTLKVVGWVVPNPTSLYFTVVVVLAIGLVFSFLLRSSASGRAMFMVRSDEAGAAVAGVNARRLKAVAFVLASVYCAVGGVLYGYVVGFVSPSNFDILLTIQFLAMAVIGGLARPAGPLIGSMFVVIVPSVLSAFQTWIPAVYGALIIVVILLMPGGIAGLGAQLGGALGRWRASHAPPSPEEDAEASSSLSITEKKAVR